MLRILSHQSADGPMHMACDEALLAHAQQSSVRTYEWSKPCLSLGYFQDYQRVVSNLDQDYPMVRRITGGGSILHQDEVTYCLVCERGSELPQRSQDMFQLIHQHIVSALREHDIPAYLNQQHIGDKHYHQDVRCFASPAVHDIMCEDAKMLGSAARHIGSRVLMHGSLKLASNSWDNEKVIGCQLDSQTAQELLIRAISQALSLPSSHGELSEHEIQCIQQYHEARYADDTWLTLRQGVKAASL